MRPFLCMQKKGHNLYYIKSLWKPPIVPALVYNHQHRLTWYCVSTSLTILCTSNYCKVFVLKLQPQIYCCWVIFYGSCLNHGWISTSLDCVSQQSTICVVCYLLSHSWHEIMVLSFKYWPWSYLSNAQTINKSNP